MRKPAIALVTVALLTLSWVGAAGAEDLQPTRDATRTLDGLIGLEPAPLPGQGGEERAEPIPGPRELHEPTDDGDWLYNVGLHVEPDQEPGEIFHGAEVLSVNHAIDFLHVRTDQPMIFESSADRDEDVRYIAADEEEAVVSLYTPEDPRVSDQWGWDPAPGIDAYGAWDTTLGTTGTTVAVIDSGLEKSHEDIGNYLDGYDYANDDGTPEDNCGHGTHVAGTVGALTDNGIGVAGTAQTTILPMKALEQGWFGCSGSFGDIADAITDATDQGADVITMSLGCSGCSDQTVTDAMQYAWDNGVLLTVAAGNDGPCTDCVGFPANDPNGMAISALDSDGSLASYSNQGPEIELAAPGSNILSTELGDSYEEKSGTSMATPHVAGTAALVLAVDDTLSNQELRDTLKSNAVDLGLDPNEQGSGGVNAGNAVDANSGGSTNSPPTADFTHACTGLICEFDGTSSTDSDGSIVSYDWDFGDGTTDAGEIVEHTYAEAGTYTVTLTVTDDDGATDTTRQDLEVEGSGGGETVLYEETFDDGEAQGWHKSDGTNDLWRVADDCMTPASGSYDLAFSRASPDCDYDVGTAEGWARSPVIDATGYTTVTLTFDHFWETESYDGAYDVMEVQVSSDGGTSWTILDDWDASVANPDDWTGESYDVTSYATDELRLRFLFDSQDSLSNDFLGWYIDNVKVTGS